MKRKFLGVLALAGITVTGITLASCGGNDAGNKNEVSKDIYGVNEEGNVIKGASCGLLFKQNSDIPYISLGNGVEIMTLLRSESLGSGYKYSIEKSGDNYVISNEAGAKCTIDPTNQTMAYDDYDKFIGLNTSNQAPLSMQTIKTGTKAIKEVSHNYTKGKSITYNLNNYSALDIYMDNGVCYLPLSVYNSALFNTNSGISLAYNGKSLFFVPGDKLSNGILGLTKLGEKFREGASKASISEEYSKYYYESVCFDFDHNFGLRDKFSSFDAYLQEKGFKNDMASTNPKTIDSATIAALTHLRDGHTALSEASNMYKYGTVTVDKSKMDSYLDSQEEGKEALLEAKKSANITNGISYSGNTAFVTFDEFSHINNNTLYVDEALKDVPGFDVEIDGSDTAVLFNELYKSLNSSTYKNTIKNVVIDLTTNEGGGGDGLLYALSTLIGEVKIDMANPITGAYNNQVYMADINNDGKIDSNDKSLIDLGFNIYFLDSKYSFSSANAMPVIAKLNNSKVTTIGQTTAGGPCAVRTNVTPIGSIISSSSTSVISKLENGKYENIDGGISADIALTDAQLVNREYIVSRISNTTK